MGFAYELKADAQGDAGKDSLEKAGKQYRELENTDVEGFKELGMYHEARVLQKQGTTDQAIDLLKKLHERLQKEKEAHSFVYLDTVADDALRSLAPDALPPKQTAGGMGGMGGLPGVGGGKGKSQLNPAQLKQLYEQFAKQQAAGGGAGKPAMPPMPAGAPK